MAQVTIDDHKIGYNGGNWVIYPLDRSTSKAAYLARNGTDLVNASGTVLASLTRDQVDYLMDQATAERDARREDEQKQERATRYRREYYVNGTENYGGDWQRNGRGEWVR